MGLIFGRGRGATAESQQFLWGGYLVDSDVSIAEDLIIDGFFLYPRFYFFPLIYWFFASDELPRFQPNGRTPRQHIVSAEYTHTHASIQEK